MNRIVRLASILMLVCIAFGLCACVQPSPQPKPNPPQGETKLKYEDIYKYKAELTSEISGKAVYKASYGYVGKTEQGYNGWYYESLDNGIAAKMILTDGVWKNGNAALDGGRMTSVDGVSAMRVFVAPVAGKAKISGTVRLVGGTSAVYTLCINGETVAEDEATDAVGSYFEQIVTLAVGDRVTLAVSGDCTVYANPTVDYTLAEEQLLHTAADGYYGDVHPYYDADSGKLYMYYLSTGLGKKQFTQQFQSLATVSGDFLHFEDLPIKVSGTNPPEQDLYFALGVYKDKNGIYRSSYGKGNYAGGSMSTDLVEWQQGAKPYTDDNGMLAYTYRAYFGQGVTSGRDPDIFYDADSDKSYCVVINYYSQDNDKGDKGLALYVSDSEGRYSTEYTKILSFTGKGDPECPQLKKIGNRWYLFYSQYGTGVAGNVGNLRYRVGTENTLPQDVDWASQTEYSLDGGDVHAAQICNVGDKFYMFGWIGYRALQNVWGGYLNLAREVYVGDNGLLYSRMDEYLTSLLNKGEVASVYDDSATVSDLNVVGNGFSGSGSVACNKSLYRNLITSKVSLDGGNASLTVAINGSGKTYYAGVVRKNNSTYLVVTDNPDNPFRHVYLPVQDDIDGAQLKVVVDDRFVEVFVADKYSLTAHLPTGGQVKYTFNLLNATLSDVKICKLANLQNVFD